LNERPDDGYLSRVLILTFLSKSKNFPVASLGDSYDGEKLRIPHFVAKRLTD
jgi:hypothetical protein